MGKCKCFTVTPLPVEILGLPEGMPDAFRVSNFLISVTMYFLTSAPTLNIEVPSSPFAFPLYFTRLYPPLSSKVLISVYPYQ